VSAPAWLNEPPEWRETDGVLVVTTGDRTDFWRETHYGFIRDDGHLHGVETSGDLAATVAFRGDYSTLYDQAGLMLRQDARNWIKAGIEFVAGRRMLSVVVTRDLSDWSTMPCPVEDDWLRLRLTRIGGAVHVHWAPGGDPDAWRMLRLGPFPGGPTQVGPMCCSPQRAGFRAEFRDFAIGPPAPPEEG
jgi:regulation of enolase protein 1 (concanavalin A-like superfamily)